jgi:hypothetical protein
MVKPETLERPCKFGTRAAAALMLLLWLGAFALVVSPELHEFFHKDCQSSDHNCLVTQIQQQSVLAGPAPVVIAPIAPPMVSAAVYQRDVLPLPSCDYRLTPSRAPPSTPVIHCA